MHELLDDLGDVPDVESILGTAAHAQTMTCVQASAPAASRNVALPPVFLGEGAVGPNDPNRESALSQLAKTTISLTLTSKFELLDGGDKDLKTLMTKSVSTVSWSRLLCRHLSS